MFLTLIVIISNLDHFILLKYESLPKIFGFKQMQFDHLRLVGLWYKL